MHTGGDSKLLGERGEHASPSRHTNMTYLMVQTGNFISTLEK